MEAIDSNRSLLQNIERLSIVDSIDSLYLFGYSSNQELSFFEKKNKHSFDYISHLKSLSNSNIKEFKLYYAYSDFEILPRKLFLYGEEKEYLKNLYPENKASINFIDQCQEEQLVIIYKINTLNDITFREIFRGLHTYHICSAFIKTKKKKNNILYAYKISNAIYFISDANSSFENISCIALKEKKLLVNVLENFLVSNEKYVNLTLCGDLDEEDLKNVENSKNIELLSSIHLERMSFLKF